jgi:hypothetical protein
MGGFSNGEPGRIKADKSRVMGQFFLQELGKLNKGFMSSCIGVGEIAR